MKAISAALADYLASRPNQIIAPDCFIITLAGGNQYFYTNADVAVVDEHGATYHANTILISGLRYKLAVGLDADEQDITIAAKPTQTIEGVPFLRAPWVGVFEGAYLTRNRVFLPAWNTAAIGSVTLFHGRFSAFSKGGRSSFDAKVKSDLVLLDADMPRNIYQPSCWYTLYGFGCGVDPTDYTFTGNVETGSGLGSITWGNAQPDGYFAQGTVTFTSGVLDGYSGTIGYSNESGLFLVAPMPALPSFGDSFTARAGCDRTTGPGGCAKFNNIANFPAFPYVPRPTTAI